MREMWSADFDGTGLHGCSMESRRGCFRGVYK